jgi:hypothetical protein
MTAITRDPGDSSDSLPFPVNFLLRLGYYLIRTMYAAARMLLWEIPVTQTCADALCG